jgi:flagellar biosynthetic protein FlhB
MFAVLMIVAVASQLGQSRFLMPKLEWSLDWQRLDVVQNMAKLFSMENISRLGINLVRTVLIATVAGYTAWTRWQQTRFLDESSLAVAAGAMGQVLLDVLFQVSLLLVILGILDYGYQLWKFEQQLRMTDDELREEAKSTQGDASIKGRRRALQQSMTDSQSYELAEADLVIMDSDGELAIAIQCDPDNVATPRIVARASRAQVVKLHQSAREQRVATFVDDDLTKSMFERFSPGEELTVEYFEALGRLFVRRTAANSSPQRPKRVVAPVQLAS